MTIQKLKVACTDFEMKVYGAVKKIPRGSVMTYATVAHVIGRPRAVRAVGNALNKNPFASVPCHRVVRSDGSIGGFNRGTRRKAEFLQREDIVLERGKVDSSFIVPPIHNS